MYICIMCCEAGEAVTVGSYQWSYPTEVEAQVGVSMVEAVAPQTCLCWCLTSFYVATVRSPRRKVATQKSPYDLTVNIQPTL